MSKKSIMPKCDVEMLFIINKNAMIGKSPDSFIKILESTDEFKISDDCLIFNDVDFKFHISEYDNKKDSLFIKISLENTNQNNLVTFSKVIRTFRKVSSECKIGQIQLIWDDISKYYSIQAYPLIHEVENLMRKLITKFMLLNVGVSWTKTSIPEEFTSLRSSTKLPEDHNMMYQVDFIQLTNFLFKAYKEIDISELIKKISPLEFNELNQETFDELKRIVPQSNWDKYFAPHIEAQQKKITESWEKLYEYRCKIAHNRDFSKADFDETSRLINEISPILKKAIEKTESINIKETDKNELADQFEDNFFKEDKTDKQIFCEAVYKLYLEIKNLYLTVYDNDIKKGDPVSRIINQVFEFIIPDEKYGAQDVMSLISIVAKEGSINKIDNFELNNLTKTCLDIRNIVSDKIIQIEISKDDADEY
ncbi:hypothetical protein EDF81_1842 [Enterobacter sp. BIGb0383]|uniref:HEPN domain-containing protein n=1 Tax=unclassified Enterobacter TaxID=2608935 RepID=UPI000F4A0D63|nr:MULTISPECIES: HEPN domain-containing protein [unclassified Enterobacter]ROP59058.1 hypothetical protein EDF81_1842 [Enterobacter sp. BIGb0383]ROS09476.1 hypothetical protein EC848_2998 [Enterobacter sp. BIGb0359]